MYAECIRQLQEEEALIIPFTSWENSTTCNFTFPLITRLSVRPEIHNFLRLRCRTVYCTAVFFTEVNDLPSDFTEVNAFSKCFTVFLYLSKRLPFTCA